MACNNEHRHLVSPVPAGPGGDWELLTIPLRKRSSALEQVKRF